LQREKYLALIGAAAWQPLGAGLLQTIKEKNGYRKLARCFAGAWDSGAATQQLSEQQALGKFAEQGCSFFLAP
jgi:hypothetical protein